MAYQFQDYENKINQSESILLVYGAEAQLPAVALTTSLFLWFKSLDKKVNLISPTTPIVEFCNLVGINKVKTKIPQENLVITMPYDENKIDKVVSDLNDNKNKLTLTIKPQKGEKPLKKEDLSINYQVADFDLYLLIDVRSTTELSALAPNEQIDWQIKEKIITLNSFDAHAPVMGEIAEIIHKDTGFCQFWGHLIKEQNVKICPDQASNLLLGLEKELDYFHHPRCTAQDFELVAWLLHQGATRYPITPPHQTEVNLKPRLPKLIIPEKK